MAHGQFIWHELLTDDVAGGRSFFSEVLGWGVLDQSHYKIFCSADDKVAGLMALPPRAVEAGAPPHWLGHVEVSDVAATSVRVESLGGQLRTPVQTVEGIGSFCVIADPLGATLSLFEPGVAFDGRGGAGTVARNELGTTDFEATWPFYVELFGWQQVADVDIGDGLAYRLFAPAGGGAPIGGMGNMAALFRSPPFWLYYFAIAELDAALDRVRQRGGDVLNGPEDVPGARIAQCRDPGGAHFALHERRA